MTPQALIRLLHMASPALPVGAFSYSQGLEWAVECGAVRDETSACRWIGDLLRWNLARWEAPLVATLMTAWEADRSQVAGLNARFLASRETAELRAETVQMGFSCRQVLAEWSHGPEAEGLMGEGLAWLGTFPEPAFPTVWSLAAASTGVPREEAVTGYLWAWLETQVMAALKLVPLGQFAGQRLLAALSGTLPGLAREACSLPESEWSNFTPAFALASCRHETQYSRLFRS